MKASRAGRIKVGLRPVGVGLSGCSGCPQLEKPSYSGSAHIGLPGASAGSI